MTQRVLDEREHRRGLVLGLTLAEVLILLLFLLLLALGAAVAKSQRAASEAQGDRDRYRSEVAGLRAEVERLRRELAQTGGQVSSGKSRSELERENAALRRQMAEVAPLIAAVERINPDDPPAARLALKRVADSLTPDDARSISAMAPGDRISVKITHRAVADGRSSTTSSPDWPPIITLSDASGYFFEPGSAEPSAEFKAKLSGSVVADMLEIIETYKVDVVEVIGHTDEQSVYSRPPLPPGLPKVVGDMPVASFEPLRHVSRYPNLDKTLIPFLNGEEPLENVLPFDNAGLGLARAAAIARILRQDDRLARYTILPLSAGQLILTSGELSAGSPGDAKDRRRIEIRMRRSDKSAK